MAIKALIFIVILVLNFANSDATDDFKEDIEDPDSISHIRYERGGNEYDIGGPLAKTGKEAGSPSSAPSSSGSPAAPAPAPVPAQAPAAKPAPASSASVPAAAPSGSKSAGPSGPAGQNGMAQASQPPAKANSEGMGKVGGCPLSVVPSSVLSDIMSNTAQLPDYNHKFTDHCKLSECAKICEKSSCNYFMRSSTNGLAYFYSIKAEKLNSPSFSTSEFYDSFIPQCSAGGALNNGNTANPNQSINPQSEPTKLMKPVDSAHPFASLQIQPSGFLSQSPPDDLLANLPGNKCPECILKDAFKKFLQKHGKSYDQYEEETRFKIFQDGLVRLKNLTSNRDPLDAMFGQTKFMDLKFPEFLKKFTGAIKELNPAEKFELDITDLTSGVPLKFDWRDEGVVPDIRNQLDCGSCYAFSSSDLTATQWAIDHSEKQSFLLAPQFVLDCIHDPAAFGCDGGRPYLVLSTNANCTGQNCAWPRESCYPYGNQAGTKCKEDLACIQDEKPEIKVQQAYYLDVSSGGGKIEKDRLSALLQGGPVVGLVTVTDHWQYYTGGVMRGSQCQGAEGTPNHAILIIGYDFTDPTSSYYIVRNTWDKDWGENGYFRMEAGTNACGISQFLSFACTADCGDGRSAKNLLDRAKRRLQGKGALIVASSTPAIANPEPVSQNPYPQGQMTTGQSYGGYPATNAYQQGPQTGQQPNGHTNPYEQMQTTGQPQVAYPVSSNVQQIQQTNGQSRNGQSAASKTGWSALNGRRRRRYRYNAVNQ